MTMTTTMMTMMVMMTTTQLPARQLDVEVVVINFVPFCCCQLHLKHQNDENGMKHGDDDVARFI